MKSKHKKKISHSLKKYNEKNKGYWKGKHLSEEHRKKLSMSNKKNKHLKILKRNKRIKGKTYEEIFGHNRGKKLREEKSKIMRNIIKKVKKWNSWKIGIPRKDITKERESKTRKELIKKGLLNPHKNMILKPNKPEKILIELINKNALPFNYVGDGKIWIENFNPDFISKNPKHIIEVFGDYWHNLSSYKKRDKKRLKVYFKYGYKTLIIWENELKNPNQVLNKILRLI